MDNSRSQVHDLVASAGSNRSSIEDRVETRLVVLREWKEKGLPLGAQIPESLTAVRLWNDPNLGILKISSPNEFTRNHPRVGQGVREIDSILAHLRALYALPSTKQRVRRPSAAIRTDPEATEKQLQAAISQWHTQRSERRAAERRAKAAEARNLLLIKDLSDRDRTIAELTAQLASSSPLRSVK
jgi:hypothetical protein